MSDDDVDNDAGDGVEGAARGGAIDSSDQHRFDEARERLLSFGSPFALIEKSVLGETMSVYKTRACET